MGELHTAVGAGRMNLPPILDAATEAEWFIVEIDNCAGDTLQALRESLDYLRNRP